MRTALILAVLLAAWPLCAQAKLVEEMVPYEHDGVTLAGYVVYDDVFEGSRPGVIVVHEWRGLDEHARKSAQRFASMGYIAFAADMYGKDVLAKNDQEAAALAKPFRDNRDLMRRRAASAYKAFQEQEMVNPEKIAAAGFCFGGTTVLEMARSGLGLAGVISFHGGLDTPSPAGPGAIKCPVLVLHGGDDPHVKPADIDAFQKEMRQAAPAWQMNIYGGAVHSFTNPNSGNDPSKGVAYNELVAERSWDAAALFLSEAFWGRR